MSWASAAIHRMIVFVKIEGGIGEPWVSPATRGTNRYEISDHTHARARRARLTAWLSYVWPPSTPARPGRAKSRNVV